MNIREVKNAIMNEKKMIWDDPIAINGNDYTIQKIWNIKNNTAMIQYGSDQTIYLSEAQVFLTEILLKN